MVGLLGGVGARDPEAVTINARKHRWWVPWEVPELEILERPPSTLGNIDGRPPWWVLTEIWERPPSTLKNVDGGPPSGVLELEIQERPPSILRNVDDGPPGGC
jgi:hypothetical protein